MSNPESPVSAWLRKAKSVEELLNAGFRPCRRGTFVSAKVPKTISARARPQGGPSASVSNYMAAQLAPLKQCSPKSRIRYCGSAAPNAR